MENCPRNMTKIPSKLANYSKWPMMIYHIYLIYLQMTKDGDVHGYVSLPEGTFAAVIFS